MKTIVINSKSSLKKLFEHIREASVTEKTKQDSTEADLGNLFSSDEAQPDAGDKQKNQKPVNKEEEPAKDDLFGGDESGNGGEQKGDITIDQVIDKFNIIRGGKSFKEQDVKAQLEKYWNEKLDDAEKVALFTFAKAISQIVSAGIDAQQAPDPSDSPNPGIEMKQKSKENVKHIKPTIIKKGSGGESKKPGKEDTAAPKKVAPIQVKPRQ
jgi:hypothetical protein